MASTGTRPVRRTAQNLLIAGLLGVGSPGFATDENRVEPAAACKLLVTLSNEPFVDESGIREIALTFDARIALRAVVEHVVEGGCDLVPGGRVVFLIHSPSLTFRGAPVEGRRVYFTLQSADPASGREWTLAEVEYPFVDELPAPGFFALLVEDLERSAAWYSRAFALVPGRRSRADDGSWEILNLSRPGLAVEIIRDDRAAAAGRALGFFKVGFAVPDVDRVAARVESATGERPRVVESADFGLRILQLRDPEGNRIQLTSPLEAPREP